MKRRTAIAIPSLVALAFACACDASSVNPPDDDSGLELPPGFDPPPPPANGVQILGVPFEVQPGEEVFQCVYLPERLSEDIDLAELVSYQMPGGHHILFSWVNDDFVPDETPHECDESEMVHHRIIGAGGNGTAIRSPEGVAFLAPAGKRLVIQSHYINATDNPIVVMDALNLVAAEGPVIAHAQQMVLVDLTFELPALQRVNRSMECNVTSESKVFSLTGHTHEWGERFSLELTRAGETTPVTLFDIDVGEGFRDEPPIISFDPEPLTLYPGDKLRMECQWFNDTAETIYYPKEMCAGPMFYYPSRGFEACSQPGGTFDLIEL